jgi:DNA-3-methyladenine glycosylase I
MVLVRGGDGRRRCWWGTSTPDYVLYHDEEWGRPIVDDAAIYERLCLEGFQSGLSWLTILRKRAGFRAAFAGFDPDRVAAFSERDVERLLGDAAIVRHRAKIEAAITNARAVVALHDQGECLGDILWAHAPSGRRPAPKGGGDIASTTPESVALAKELKRRGFVFIGPTTAYAAMQAMGVVNDHLVGCHVRAACTQAGRLAQTARLKGPSTAKPGARI